MSFTRALLWIIIVALVVLLGWSIFQFVNRRQQVVEVGTQPTLTLVPSATASAVVVPTQTPQVNPGAVVPRATASAQIVAGGSLPNTGADASLYVLAALLGLGAAAAVFRYTQLQSVKSAYRR
jgi:LPXTG-motif cell wall-anchored protein